MSMLGTATRVAVVAGCTALALGTVALPSDAASTITVSLAPTYGPVGRVIDVRAASGLADVTAVTFGAGSQAARAGGETSDTDVHVKVPAGAKTGVLTLTKTDTTTLTTDRTFTVQQPTQATIHRSRPEVLFPGTAWITA